MSSNSLNFTNVKDGIFNNLYLINDNGELDNVKDIVTAGAGDLTSLQTQINAKANKTGDTFSGPIIVPAITLNGISLSQSLN